MDHLTQSNYVTPTTTTHSGAEGRLKVDVGRKKKRIVKKAIKKYGK